VERRTVALSVESIDPQGFDPMLRTGGTFLGTVNRSLFGLWARTWARFDSSCGG
jgi:hypothetical protein